MFEIFKSYQFNKEKAHAYGFIENGEVWTNSCQILQGDFIMTVSITTDNVSFQVFDQETGDLYPQVHMESMTGDFVGMVREACLEILLDIRRHCFDEVGFLYEQSQRLVTYVADTYKGSLEYLWAKHSRKSSTQAAVFRHDGSKKWYGAFMTTDWSKFDSKREGRIEVLNVKSNDVATLTQQKGIYPAFHMNKKYWCTICLDGTVELKEIYKLIDISYELAK